ncbi:MAG TPA: hypothetical protein VLA80_03880 [Actinomycetota bacterium]|nr:hypothetical protein [Actinomycetota bacterium]
MADDPTLVERTAELESLVCVDDRGHYLGVLRIEQPAHRLLAGPRP